MLSPRRPLLLVLVGCLASVASLAACLGPEEEAATSEELAATLAELELAFGQRSAARPSGLAGAHGSSAFRQVGVPRDGERRHSRA